MPPHTFSLVEDPGGMAGRLSVCEKLLTVWIAPPVQDVIVVGLSRLILALTSSGGQNFLDNWHPVRSAVAPGSSQLLGH